MSVRGEGNISRASENVTVYPAELLSTKNLLIDLLIQELKKTENYWCFRYRELTQRGLRFPYRSQMDVTEQQEGVAISLTIEVGIPAQLVYDVTVARKRKRYRPPKPRPTTRQMLREAEEVAEEMLNTGELEEESEAGDTGGEEDIDSG